MSWQGCSSQGSRGWGGRGQRRGLRGGRTHENLPGHHHFRRDSSEKLPPPKPLGLLVDSIDINTLLVDLEAPKIEEVEYVASYNWLEGESSVILVPGSPPAWTPPVTDSQMKRDRTPVFRDINAARYQSFPMEPAMRSLKAMRPDFNMASVDVFGCGSTIGNLLRAAGSKAATFQFDVDVVGGAVYFLRKSASPTELITNLHGYNHQFSDAYTTWGPEVRNSSSHQRIVQYVFGGLQFLVRSETDGYLLEPGSNVLPATGSRETPLADAIATFTISNPASAQSQDLQLQMMGTKIPQNRIFDLKTRAKHNAFDMDDILPRLWINQTPNFLIAYHQAGLFDHPKVKNIRPDVIEWETDNSSLLARFHALITRIIDTVRDHDKQQCEVTWYGNGTLLINEQSEDGKRALPSDLVEALENGNQV